MLSRRVLLTLCVFALVVCTFGSFASGSSNSVLDQSMDMVETETETETEVDLASACEKAGGSCLHSKFAKCGTSFQTGLCPGDAVIQCCVAAAAAPAVVASPRCTAAKGVCADSTKSACSVSFRTGLCAGVASVQCCTGKLTLNSAAASGSAASAAVPAESFANARASTLSAAAQAQADMESEFAASAAAEAEAAAAVGPAPTPAAPSTAPSAAPSTPSSATAADNKCTAIKGHCTDSSLSVCSAPFQAHLCPGASFIKCCVGSSTEKPNQRSELAQGLVDFKKLKECYPQGLGPAVKKVLGGAIDADWITNTCAIRMSHTLNCAGRIIPQMGGESIRGKRPNRWNYIFRVKQLSPMVKKIFGAGKTIRAPTGRGVPISSIAGKKGILYFDTTGEWDDATGHFDLWDGNLMVEESHANKDTVERYFRISVAITFWEMK